MKYQHLQFFADALPAINQQLEKTGIARPLIGATEEEIAAAERHISRRFPSAVREFFAIAGGRSYDIFWSGLHWANNHMGGYKEMWEQFMGGLEFGAEDIPHKNPPHFFDNLMLLFVEAEECEFVLANEGDDPPVYRYRYPMYSAQLEIGFESVAETMSQYYKELAPTRPTEICEYWGCLKLAPSLSAYIAWMIERFPLVVKYHMGHHH